MPRVGTRCTDAWQNILVGNKSLPEPMTGGRWVWHWSVVEGCDDLSMLASNSIGHHSLRFPYSVPITKRWPVKKQPSKKSLHLCSPPPPPPSQYDPPPPPSLSGQGTSFSGFVQLNTPSVWEAYVLLEHSQPLLIAILIRNQAPHWRHNACISTSPLQKKSRQKKSS